MMATMTTTRTMTTDLRPAEVVLTEEARETPAPVATRRRWPRKRAFRTIRRRVLTALLLMTGAGLVLASTINYAMQRYNTDVELDSALMHLIDEYRAYVDGETEQQADGPHTTTSELLYSAMRLILPTNGGETLAVVDGKAEWLTAGPMKLRLHTDAAFIASVAKHDPAEGVVLRSTTLHAAGRGPITIRYVAVPTRVDGDPSTGWYVAAVDRSQAMATVDRTFLVNLTVAAAVLLIIAVASMIVVRRLLEPIRVLRDTAEHISDTDLAKRVPVAGNDDLADLARTINGMLARLESAFTAQKHLVDDVSHELRTPLTIVQGHLELVDTNSPEDVEQVRDITLDEVHRMRALVDSMMVLATANRPDFLQLESVDVCELTESVFEKARALGKRNWVLAERARTVTTLDPLRVTQAWLQLASNAVQYSDDGTTVTLGSRVERTEGSATIVLWIKDEGYGVAEGDRERIFERFGRAASGRGSTGSGLGLSIVGAIASAHEGEAQYEPGPDEVGSVFSLHIPADRPIRSTSDSAEPSGGEE